MNQIKKKESAIFIFEYYIQFSRHLQEINQICRDLEDNGNQKYLYI